MSEKDTFNLSRTDCSPWRDEETLRHFYHGKGYSLLETAQVVGCTEGTVSQWCNRLGVETRDAQEARDTGTPSELESEDWLRREYKTHERTCADIADELDVTSLTVSRWLGRHGIDARPAYGTGKESVSKECGNCGDTYEVIPSRADDSKYCSRSCYYEAQEMPTGEDHWSWKCGKYPRYNGQEWQELRKRCMERDGYECQLCDAGGSDGSFHVHHIQPVRTFDDPKEANTLDNVVYLCAGCHRRVERLAPLLPPGLK